MSPRPGGEQLRLGFELPALAWRNTPLEAAPKPTPRPQPGRWFRALLLEDNVTFLVRTTDEIFVPAVLGPRLAHRSANDSGIQWLGAGAAMSGDVKIIEVEQQFDPTAPRTADNVLFDWLEHYTAQDIVFKGIEEDPPQI